MTQLEVMEFTVDESEVSSTTTNLEYLSHKLYLLLSRKLKKTLASRLIEAPTKLHPHDPNTSTKSLITHNVCNKTPGITD